MAILHGNWLINSDNNSYFFVWGETWRSLSLSSQDIHPFVMSESELLDFLLKYDLSLDNLSFSEENILLPNQFPISQIQSDSDLKLQSWMINGIVLNPLQTIKFLQTLPLTDEHFLGGDLKFWIQVYRWSLDLIARCKFLPNLIQKDNQIISRWQPLLDSSLDQARLAKFSQNIPLICLSYNHSEPQGLILNFLSEIIDSNIRLWSQNQTIPKTDPLINNWFKRLSSKNNILETSPSVKRLQSVLNNWITPIQDYVISDDSSQTKGITEKLFRTCFILKPPAENQADWQLEYVLQAIDKPDFIIDNQIIWQHPVNSLKYENKIIENPQETFLKGLGLGAKIYPVILDSLNESQPEYCILNPVEAYQFIQGISWKLQDHGLGVIIPESLAQSRNDRKRLGLKISATTEEKTAGLGLQSLLKFQWELAIGDQTISVEKFKEIVELKTPFVQVNGEWLALQPTDIKSAKEFLAKPQTIISLSLEDALRLSTGDTKTIEKLPIVSFETSGVLENFISNLTDNRKIELIEIPETFKGELRPYQLRGVSWLNFMVKWGLGACLADDMGLGKTIQLITFILHLKVGEKLDKPVLIICPTSVLGNWEKEIKKFAPNLQVLQHYGTNRPKNQEFLKAIKNQDIVITSYALVTRDIVTLNQVEWTGIILDEAQNIKNYEAKQAQNIRKLKGDFRIALTGTPVENRLTELWSILDFLNPDYLGTKQFFQRRFALPIEKYGDKDSVKILRSLVQPFILRRLKTDKSIIQDLPEKQEMNIFCGLTTEQATIYQKLVEESLQDIDQSEGIQRHGMILSLLMKLKQICNHPAHFLKEKNFKSGNRSGKLQRLEEMLLELVGVGDRALIFTQFAEFGKLLQPYLQEKLGEEILFLYGGTKKQQREEMIERFQNDPQGPKIFILSLKAGGTGLNLTRANHVFHYDRWWNPAVENQATDRVFRIGQKRNVQVHKFICTGTLEEKINDLIESKKSLADQTINSGENWLTEMDTEQLRNLLLLDRGAMIIDN